MDLTFDYEDTLYEESLEDSSYDSTEKKHEEFPTNSAVCSYLRKIGKYPILTQDEEQELAKKVSEGDKQAREKFINSNLRLVVFIAKKFLPVMDALDAALKQTPDDDGIKSLAMALNSAFAQIGIVKIESLGQQLNPQFHSAISTAPADDEHAPNTIFAEMQAGYMYGDTVLRPAMVVVAK